MPDESCGEAAIDLCPEPRSPAAARAFVRHWMDELGFPWLVEDAALIAVEMVTNAVRDAPGGPIRLSLRLSAGRPVIEVRDCSPVLPVRQPPDVVAETGRGLHIMDALAEEIGWHRCGQGKVVWAALR
ncbi:MAG TPA: ATP-binding protein [Streptosporangiaceae bacterium]